MKTSLETTAIFLERNVEDVKLYNEILDITGRLASHMKPRTIIKKYPTLWDLKQKLLRELQAEG